MKTTQESALERINGSIINGKVVYYDDSMRQWYSGPSKDVKELQSLMDSSDDKVSGDAYSHWCSENCHEELGVGDVEEAEEKFSGWSDGKNHDELSAMDYFDGDNFIGPDCDGLYPIFVEKT